MPQGNTHTHTPKGTAVDGLDRVQWFWGDGDKTLSPKPSSPKS